MALPVTEIGNTKKGWYGASGGQAWPDGLQGLGNIQVESWNRKLDLQNHGQMVIRVKGVGDIHYG